MSREPGTRLSDLDRALGKVIRECRVTTGASQQQMADACGMTYQQMHKYERGLNRVSAAMLVTIAAALGKDPGEMLQRAVEAAGGAPPANNRQTLELARVAIGLPTGVQNALAAFARRLQEEMTPRQEIRVAPPAIDMAAARALAGRCVAGAA